METGEKKAIGARNFLYPMPTILVGADVNGKPNYLTIAFCGIVQASPPMIAVALGKMHYTNEGIRENNCFSVNIPSRYIVEATDYCGMVSGKKVDKSSIFKTFYGKLKKAPMIQECPLNLECRLVDTLNFGGANEVFIGEIVESYAEEQYLCNGVPDIEKVEPIVFSMYDNNYWGIGKHLGKAWGVGKKFSENINEKRNKNER
ncbi:MULTISPECIES: flavin reductase family protein [unclassified Methanosarcina]|uniref:flavin reductase family protein n=1 Tax=unclassified Methanosarcina TaxID=2644672 RepID=UPI000615C4B4|nr:MULTISPECIES: flavin reductase family protein [unclassified Methanosarcina]AKB19138.1 putative NADPH-flavin oxidoreductase [Methanosarcina sp. WWM596]AKB23034.1 putative NADPH-flavin oxidoreductase [Methanosarcina sp. WH1]